MDSASAPNVSSRTLDPLSLLAVDHFTGLADSRSHSLPVADVGGEFYVNIMDDEAQSEDRGVSTSFRSTASSSWNSFSSRVTTVPLEPSLRISLFSS